MIELTPDESRVLGVLVEKAITTPEQYPLSLNVVVAGANQRNNRDPVLSMTEDEAFDALEGLRGKGLVVRIEAGAGSRVHRFRHNATDGLRVRGRRVETAAARTDFENEESRDRFWRLLEQQGIDLELRRRGAGPGTMVRIGDAELEWGEE